MEDEAKYIPASDFICFFRFSFIFLWQEGIEVHAQLNRILTQAWFQCLTEMLLIFADEKGSFSRDVKNALRTAIQDVFPGAKFFL